jgi:hypothetical protein
MAGDVSMRLPLYPLYLAAMKADDDYRDVVYRYCKRKSRYSLTPEDNEIPAIKAAYARKVEADRVWLSALRLLGHSTEDI